MNLTVDLLGVHKRSLHLQNDTENKRDVLGTPHLHHQSVEKHSKFCFK
jgi:hypothetical protein